MARPADVSPPFGRVRFAGRELSVPTPVYTAKAPPLAREELHTEIGVLGPMSTSVSLGAERLYVVTPEGHAAALAEESCECDWVIEPPHARCTRCGWLMKLLRPAAQGRDLKRA